ncbi:MAG: tetratricopeptide repeat protein, partial [Desulfobacteraceae bacterium]
MRFNFNTVFLVLITAVFFLGCASDEEKKLSHFKKGVGYFDTQEYKSAEIELKNAIQIDPNYIDAYAKLGETYLKMGDGRGAYREYSMVAKLDPENTDALLKLATFLMLGKQYDESRAK